MARYLAILTTLALCLAFAGSVRAADADEEVDELKDEITRLRDENRSLRQEIRALEAELRALREDLAAADDAAGDQDAPAGDDDGKSKDKYDDVEGYLADHPDVDKDIAKAMKKGDVVEGMTLEEAELSLRSLGKKMLKTSKYYAMKYRVDFKTLRQTQLSGYSGGRVYSAEVDVLTRLCLKTAV